MSTRSTSSNLSSPLRVPESLIRQRNLGEPSSLFDFEEVMSIPHNNMGSPPVGPPSPNNGLPSMVRPNGPAPRSMKELCQPSINGRGEPIAPIPIKATDFGLRHHMIQQVQNTCQFHRLPGDDANRHIDKFLEITQHMKQNGVSGDSLRLSLFPYYFRPPGSLPSNTVANPRGDVKAITTQSGVAYDGPSIPPTPSPLPKEAKRETEATKDKDIFKEVLKIKKLSHHLSGSTTSTPDSSPSLTTDEDYDDESLPEEDVQEENFKIYSNPLFEFDIEYISSDVNPLFNEELEDIESNDSYVSNLDESVLPVTPLSNANEDECFDPGGKINEINAFLDMDVSTVIEVSYHDSEGDEIFLEYLLKEIASMDSYLLFSSGSEDIIFEPGIPIFSFYSLKP
ncbi:hypothetical protein Tco_0988761, partial [Tanacetum coccineum]